MQTPEQPILRDIVLVGGGHSHVGVLRRFAMKPEPGVRLTLICRDTHTPYSGMLPGYVAGHYAYDEVHIDLGRLAEFAGARFLRDEVVGLDRESRTVICRDRPPVAWDQLSINIGSTPQTGNVPGAAGRVVPVKPINNFNDRWQALLERLEHHRGDMTIAVVGAGAGGVELTLAMQYRLRTELARQGRTDQTLHFHLFQAKPEILPTHNERVRNRFERVLTERGVRVHRNTRITAVDEQDLVTENGDRFGADEILWVTQAGGPAWLREAGLDLDDNGFIKVSDTLQTLTDERIFAAGDIATMIHHPREKAGVFAVRQGRPLADNLRRAVRGEALKPYRPQKHWMALISTGNRHAVASRGPLGFSGDWVWRWKDRIDRRFMARYNDLPEMREEPADTGTSLALAAEETGQAISALAMRCGGCGAKVGSSVLSRALERLQPVSRKGVLAGLDSPDDAALLQPPPEYALVQTVDFFRAFIDDPWMFGRVTANHCLGDVFAMGAEPWTAQALATLPPGLESKIEEQLLQMMSGALGVLNDAGCALVGGHTAEGSELALGFAINGLVEPEQALRKAGLRPGDRLILTKSLGTGTLFAALARLQARGRWIDTALESMCLSGAIAARLLREHGARACTDVTGFGLLGHLLEMTRPSDVAVTLDLEALPMLPGAVETLALGIHSSLQPDNVRLRRALGDQEDARSHPLYPLLFDPQTAGGLLAGVPAERADACLRELHAAGYGDAAIIGSVKARGDQPELVQLRS